MLLDVFEYNQHFVAMMNIINMARLNQPKEGHKHHIIPRCWFKMNNLPVDNSKDNLVLLSYEDHIKVHKLAFLCAKVGKFRGKMAYAYHRLTKGELVSNDCFRGEQSSRYSVKVSSETRKKMSAAHKGRTFSEEHRKKLSESHKGKSHPFTMSEENIEKNRYRYKNKTWKVINGKRVWLSKEIV